MKKILKYILILIFLICMYCITLELVCIIPSSWMKENVKESANYFLEKRTKGSYKC